MMAGEIAGQARDVHREAYQSVDRNHREPMMDAMTVDGAVQTRVRASLLACVRFEGDGRLVAGAREPRTGSLPETAWLMSERVSCDARIGEVKWV